jgi:hypothetical protein
VQLAVESRDDRADLVHALRWRRRRRGFAPSGCGDRRGVGSRTAQRPDGGDVDPTEHGQRHPGADAGHDCSGALGGVVGELAVIEVLIGEQHPAQRAEWVVACAELLGGNQRIGVLDGA